MSWRAIGGFAAAPPIIGLVTAVTLDAPNMHHFADISIVATIVAACATIMLGVPAFRHLVEQQRTRWHFYLLKGAWLGVIVSALVILPVACSLLLPHAVVGPTAEIPNDIVALAAVAIYCAFLGMIGATVFCLIVRPDRRSARPDRRARPHI
jgi:hypothetical protein